MVNSMRNMANQKKIAEKTVIEGAPKSDNRGFDVAAPLVVGPAIRPIDGMKKVDRSKSLVGPMMEKPSKKKNIGEEPIDSITTESSSPNENDQDEFMRLLLDY